MASKTPKTLPEGLTGLPIGVLAIRVELFAQALCRGENQSQAYLTANPESARLSKVQLAQRASQFARCAEVVKRVERIQYEMLQRHIATADSLLAKHFEIIKADVVDMFDDSWSALPPGKLKPELRTALERVKVTEKTTFDPEGNPTITKQFEFSLASKQRSIEAAAKMLGVDEPKTDKDNAHGVDDLVEALILGVERANQKIQARRSAIGIEKK